MELINIGGLLVALIAAASAYASQRAAAKASTTNVNTTSRVDMEKEAYGRARDYDTETIRRQDQELDEIRKDLHECQEENKALKIRIARLERGLTQNLEEVLRERLKEPATDDEQ